ncbi:MAG: hypothetical protein RR992_04725 [Clostridiales bacterium]
MKCTLMYINGHGEGILPNIRLYTKPHPIVSIETMGFLQNAIY